MTERITIAIPYYDAPHMLRKQVEHWRMFPQSAAERFSVVIVDDGSQKFPAEDVLTFDRPFFPLKLFRIEENIPWNHGGARNLSMRIADDGWIISTDIDLVLDAENAERLLELELVPNTVYRPNRLDLAEDGTWFPFKRHPESFVMTKEMFWKIGGYDEDFTGFWNGSFTPFRKKLKRTARRVDLEDVYLKNYCKVVEDAMVLEWGRRGSEYDIHTNSEMYLKRRAATRNYNPINPLRFTWKQVI